MDVEGDGPVLNIVDVESAALVEGNVATTGNLREASEAGFDR